MDNFKVVIRRIKLMSGKKIRVVSILSLLAIALALPVTLSLVKQRQDIRQRAETVAAVPFYRLLKSAGGSLDHFYTASQDEVTSAKTLGYTLENVTGNIFPTQVPGSLPLYRLNIVFPNGNGDHFYTLTEQEKNSAVSEFRYTYEGIAGYIFPNQLPGTVPLYRVYIPFNNGAEADHFYTTSEAEKNNAVDALHGTYEGITGYILPSGVTTLPTETPTVTSIPTATPAVTTVPTPIACTPRPACLDNPQSGCFPKEPAGGWCPVTPTPAPTSVVCTPRPSCLDNPQSGCFPKEPAGGWCPPQKCVPLPAQCAVANPGPDCPVIRLEPGQTFCPPTPGVCTLGGQYEIDFTTSGGSVYHHTMTIQMTGPTSFTGTGYIISDPSFTWNINGNILFNNGADSPTVTYEIIYTGTEKGYTVNGTGTINPDGTMSGSSTDSLGAKLPWKTNSGQATCVQPPTPCIPVPALCTLSANGSLDCHDRPTPLLPPGETFCRPNPGGQTQLAFDVLVHGIGKGGDNASTASVYNAPKDPNRSFDVQLTSVTNPKNVIDRSAMLTYDESSGSFKGNVSIDNNGCFVPGVTPNPIPSIRPVGPISEQPVATSSITASASAQVCERPVKLIDGTYQIRIKGDQTLGKIYPRAVTIQSGQIMQLPQIALVNGDINGDNSVDMNDFNLLYGCFSDLGPARSCTDAQKQAADLNDDGKVNGIDYNILVRELSSRHGD